MKLLSLSLCMAFEVRDCELILQDDWGVREWFMPDIERDLDALLEREGRKPTGSVRN